MTHRLGSVWGLIGVCLLAGCATTQPQPIAIGTAPPLPAVQVPVFKPCIDAAQLEPDPPSAMPPRTAGIAELAAGAAADALRYRELARRRGELLKACASKPEETK